MSICNFTSVHALSAFIVNTAYTLPPDLTPYNKDHVSCDLVHEVIVVAGCKHTLSMLLSSSSSSS